MSKEVSNFVLGKKLGQSNSGIELVEFPNHRVGVRKFSHDQSERLEIQFKKHLEVTKVGIPDIRIPRILKSFQSNSYVMEYMPGIPLGFFLESATQSDVQHLANRISSYFQFSLNNSSDMSKPNMLEEKLNLISKKLSHSMNDPFSQLLEALRPKISSLIIPSGWNHGDFSFENLLIIPETLDLVFLDFLDSPLETILIDIGRFWLDAQFGWWGSGLNPSANSDLNSQFLARMVSNFCRENNISEQILVVFASLATLRIYPYTKDPVRMAFLKKASRQLTEML